MGEWQDKFGNERNLGKKNLEMKGSWKKQNQGKSEKNNWKALKNWRWFGDGLKHNYNQIWLQVCIKVDFGGCIELGIQGWHTG